MEFFYDESGRPEALRHNGLWYYYVTNLQGDVVKIIGTSGTSYAEYSYNAWGEVLTATGTLALVNPLRYRGYYYDTETKLYYLQSRYYDPALCRFINADGLASTGQGLLGCNMFAYCNNNPVNMLDDSGLNPVSLWYYLMLYSDFGYIHLLVQEQIGLKYKISRERYVRRENGSLGRVDLINGNKEVWEVKYKNSAAAAVVQVTSYLNSTIISTGEKVSGLGAAGAFKGQFTINYLGVSYRVVYWTPQAGVVLYDVKTLDQYEPQPSYHYVPRPERQNNKKEAFALALAFGVGAFAANGLAGRESHNLNFACA